MTSPADPTSGRPGRSARVAVGVGVGVLILIPVAILAARRRPAPDPGRIAEAARAEIRAGRFAEADRLVGRLEAIRPATAEDRLLRAQVAGALDRTDAAVLELSRIPDDHPLGEVARLSQGQLEARRGRLRKAEEAFLATLARRPDNLQARRELVYIYSVQRRLSRLDQQLNGLAERGALDKTHLTHWGRVRHVPWSAAADLSALERYVAADPEDLASRLSLADAYIRLNRLDDADTTLAAVSESAAEPLAVRARLAEARGDSAGVDAILASGPDRHAELARMRGQRALLRREAAAAVRHFKIAETLDPFDRATMFGLGMALDAVGDHDGARLRRDKVRAFDRLGELISKVDAGAGPEDAALARRLGAACAELGRAAEARAWLRLAIARDPLDAEAQRALYQLDEKGSPVTTPSATARD